MSIHRFAQTRVAPFAQAALIGLAIFSGVGAVAAQAIVQRIEAASQQLEMTVSTSRILTLDNKIPRAQVNNPELLGVTPLSPTQIQISAIKPGVTQVNLWDEQGKIYTVDVTIYGDVAELEATLKQLFPHSSVRALRISNSLVMTGFVDQPSNVSTIMRLAEDYAPKVVDNITVGGVQQILLNVQVMEVSRTKLRQLGFDFAEINGNDFVISSISGLIAAASSQTGSVTASGDTLRFGVINNANSFFGFLKALRQNDLMKILAEPKLATVSGRPASFNVGGEFPVLVPQSLGTVSIEYKKFGTQIEFVPIVLDNGNSRLEVRPRVSEIDNPRSVVVNNFTIPGLRVREVDTGVEMKAGQTLAIAGLVQSRIEAQNRGLPILADLPWIGAAFRSVHETSNEIELLILVRPELVDAMDPHEVPPCGPGMGTRSPSDCDLYFGGKLEVPTCDECSDNGCPVHGGTYHGNGGAPEEVAPPPAAGQDQARRPRSSQPSSNAVSTRRGTSAGQGRNPYNPANANGSQPRVADRRAGSAPGLIGPVGYDVLK
jgi:pilus assembly protein CpaC